MIWLVAIVVLILLIVSAGFRKFAFGLVVLALAVGTIVYLYNEQEESRSLKRISISELALENVRLDPDSIGYKLSGRIKNNSARFTLKRVQFAITMKDCAGEMPSPNCVTIGEEKESVYLDIPPGQARDFHESLYFSGGSLEPKGRSEWNYSVSQIKGE